MATEVDRRLPTEQPQSLEAGRFWFPDALPPTAAPSHHEFYVSNSGDDKNPGTKELPWKTVDRVNKEQLQPGDSVFFHAHEVFTGRLLIQGGSDEHPIVIGSYGGRDANDPAFISSITSSNTRATNWLMRGSLVQLPAEGSESQKSWKAVDISKVWLPDAAPERTKALPGHHAYYVSNSGDDSNPGTRALPWKTIDRVNKAQLSSGDSVFFHAGDKFSGNLFLDGRGKTSDILFSTYGGNGSQDTATIEAHSGNGALIENTGGVVLRNLHFVGDRATNTGFGVEVINQTNHRLNGVVLDNVDAEGFKWCGAYVGGTPILPGVRLSQKPERWGFNDVVFKHVKAHNNTYFGILTSGPWVWEIPANQDPTKQIWQKLGQPGQSPQSDSSLFRLIGSGTRSQLNGLTWGDLKTIFSQTVPPTRPGYNPGYANANVRVIDCQAYDNPGDPNYHDNHSGNGILIDDTDGAIVEHSKAWHNGAENGSQSGGPVGIWANQSNRVLIQHNKSFDNRSGGLTDGDGIDLDGGVTNSLVQYNETQGNDGAGYLVWSYWGSLRPVQNNVFAHNVSIDDGRKFTFGGIDFGNSGSQVDSIDAFDNKITMTRNGTRPTIGNPRGIHVSGGNPNTNIRFWDNEITVGAGVPLVDVQQPSTTFFWHNTYIAPPGQFNIMYNGQTYQTLRAWQQATQQETQPIP